MSAGKASRACLIVQRHYRLARPVTLAEVRAEVANMRRRIRDALGLFDDQVILWDALQGYLDV